MYQEQINAYWSDPARREELVSILSRLVAVRNVLRLGAYRMSYR